eukprot:8422940-Pyramimonas_sp.AAC.1
MEAAAASDPTSGVSPSPVGAAAAGTSSEKMNGPSRSPEFGWSPRWAASNIDWIRGSRRPPRPQHRPYRGRRIIDSV